ncbi:MAG: flagellar hook-basal body complex protein [Alphaproteobacteria bacterium]
MGMMTTAGMGMKVQQGFMDSHTGNIANAKTDGFMPEVPSFLTQVIGGKNGVAMTVQDAFYIQGPVEMTENQLDLAVDGPGFLMVDSTHGKAFKKSARGELDKDGYYRDEGLSYVMGIPANEDGTFPNMTGSSFDRIKIDLSSNTASATSQGKLSFNLPANAQAGDTQTTEIPVYDSLGIEHQVRIIWTRQANPFPTWQGIADVLPDSTATPEGTVTGDWAAGVDVTFTDHGILESPDPAPNLTVTGWTSGAADSDVALDLSSATQLGEEFVVTELKTDGAGFGTYVSISIGQDGVLSARYSNGESKDLWKIGLASFPAVTGLERKSNNLLLETSDSGKALFADAGQGSVGSLLAKNIVASASDLMTSQIEILSSSQVFSACSGAFGKGRDCEEIVTGLLRS